jgi:cell wall-associated NlpC family hydrolase
MPIFFRSIILASCGAIFIISSNPVSAATAPGIRRLGYAIQMGAFADVKNAERFSTALQKKGIEAFYFRKDNGIYAVRFGDFSTKNKARSIAAKLVADKLIDSYYIAPPNEVVFSTPKEPGWQKQPPAEIRQPREQKRSNKNRTEESTDKNHKKSPRGERDMGFIVARTAERFVGIPYRWGGENVVDGMDCSGFVRAVYNLCGVSIPRTSREQYKAGESVTRSTLLDGDLVFFGSAEDKINHVGIYVGNGKFVHAPRRGEEIRITSIEDSYFDKRFIGARRYFQ